MLSYRVTLDMPFQLVMFVSGLLARRRREIGTRRGTRALTCSRQAVFALAWFRDRPDVRRLGQGFGISQATAYRYLAEAIEVLAAKAPSLRQALDNAKDLGLPYLILDGTIVAADRCAEKKTSRKGQQIDRWYPGKAHHPGGNIQALTAPHGVPLWVSDVLPGSTHDLTAARVHVPVKQPAGGRCLDINTQTRNALLRSLRYQGERGFALMTQRWRTPQQVMLSPRKIGDIAKSALVLVQFEHKMIS